MWIIKKFKSVDATLSLRKEEKIYACFFCSSSRLPCGRTSVCWTLCMLVRSTYRADRLNLNEFILIFMLHVGIKASALPSYENREPSEQNRIRTSALSGFYQSALSKIHHHLLIPEVNSTVTK